MRKSREILGLPVISLEEGLKLGNVKTLIVNPAAKAVVALVVEEKGFFKQQKFIPYPKVHSVGANALTVSQSSSAAKSSSLPELVQLWKEKTAVTGSRIVTENGTVLGWVQDYLIDTETGGITGLEIASSAIGRTVSGRAYVPADVLRTIGKEIIVATDEALDQMRKVDGGIGGRIKDAFDRTREAVPRLPARPKAEEVETAEDGETVKSPSLLEKTRARIVSLPKLRKRDEVAEEEAETPPEPPSEAEPPKSEVEPPKKED